MVLYSNRGWRGSYIYDVEEQRRRYSSTPSQQRRNWYRYAAFNAARNVYKHGAPVVAAYVTKKFGFGEGGKRIAVGPPDNVAQKKRKVSFLKSVGKSNKMVRRGRRVRKRSRSMSKRVYKRKYKKRRFKKRRSSSSGVSLRRKLAVPQTLKQSFSSMYGVGIGKAAYLIFDVTHSLWHNNQISLASGHIGSYSTTNLSSQQLITKFLHRLNITSQTSADTFIKVTECYCKKDYKHGSYTGSNAFENRAGQYNAPNAILDWADASVNALGNSGTDAKFTFAAADATNNRLPARIVVDNPQLPIFNRQFFTYFGISKSYPTKKLDPNGCARYSINDQ